jgi:DNA-binding XRE family transcriptional regulator
MTSDPAIRRMWPTPQLIRAARGLVNIDQETLAAAAGVSRKAVISLEGDESETMDYRRLAVLQKLRRVLEEKWGIEFVQEVQSSRTGVVLRKAQRKPFGAQHYRRLGLPEIVMGPWIARYQRTSDPNTPCRLLK